MFSFSSGLLKYSRLYMYVNLKLTKFSFDFAGLTEKSSFLYSGHKIRECERNAKEGKKLRLGMSRLDKGILIPKSLDETM